MYFIVETKNIKSKELFNNSFIPTLLIKKVFNDLDKNRIMAVNSYLKNNFKNNITVLQILSVVFNTLVNIKESENTTILKVSDGYYKGYKISYLFKLINYGNLEVRGLDIANELNKFLKKNQAGIKFIYRLTTAKMIKR